jgi:kojibiose phosphorylase
MDNKAGGKADFVITMYSHYAEPDLDVMNIELTPHGNDELTIATGIDATTPPDAVDFYKPGKPGLDSTNNYLTYATSTNSDQEVATAQRFDLCDEDGRSLEVTPDFAQNGARHMQSFTLQGKAGKTVHALALTSTHSSVDQKRLLHEDEDIPPKGAAQADVNRFRSFKELSNGHEAKWSEQWGKISVPHVGNPDVQGKILHCLSTIMADAGADGLGYLFAGQGAKIGNEPGEGYGQRAFWENLILVAAILSEVQQQAEIQRRLKQVPAAEAKAAGLEDPKPGLFMPWESSTPENGESGPQFLLNPAKTAVVEVMTLTEAVHINADVVHAIAEYYKLTKDEAILQETAQLVEGTTRFLVACTKQDQITGKYGIPKVTGPDEYHEGVDDEAYTLLMTAKTLRFAKFLRQEGLINLSEDEAKNWDNVYTNLNIPFNPETLLFTPFKGYGDLSHRTISLAREYPGVTELDGVLQQEQLDKAVEAYRKSNPEAQHLDTASIIDLVKPRLTKEQINPIFYTNIAKQPALTLGIYLTGDELIDILEDRLDEATMQSLLEKHGGRESLRQEIAYRNVKKRDLDIIDGSSLSPVIRVLTKLDAGIPADECYEQFIKALGMDLDDADTHKTIKGLHTANAAAAVQAVERGFMGIKPARDKEGNGVLHVNPNLPSAWPDASCTTHYFGTAAEIFMDRESGIITIVLPEGADGSLHLNIQGFEATLSPENPIIRVQNGQPYQDDQAA